MNKTKQTLHKWRGSLQTHVASFNLVSKISHLKSRYKRLYAKTLTRLHQKLTTNLSWYRNWHQWRYHKHFQYGAISLSAIVIVAVLSITTLVHASGSTWTQTDWSGGVGTSTTNQYSSQTNDTTSTANQVTLAQSSGPAWYNASWGYRKSITFNNTTANIGTTAETLTNFPVLVELTSSNFNFSKAQSVGQDIRFTASDGVSLLSYQIESWDSVAQQAYI